MCRACSGSVLAALCRACMTLHPVLQDSCVAQGGTAVTTAQQMRTRHGTELDLSSNYVRAERSVPQPEHAREGSSPRVAAPKNQSSRTGKARSQVPRGGLATRLGLVIQVRDASRKSSPGWMLFSASDSAPPRPGQVAHWHWQSEESRFRAKFRRGSLPLPVGHASGGRRLAESTHVPAASGFHC